MIKTKKTTEKAKLKNILQKGKIAFFGYEGARGFSFLATDNAQVTYFVKDYPEKDGKKLPDNTFTYIDYTDVRNSSADVCFLDNDAIRVLVAGFPAYVPFTLVRIRIHQAWFWGFLGLLRRMLRGHVRLLGIRKEVVENKVQRWLILQSTIDAGANTTFGISKEIGTEGLIAFCNNNNISYVVLRNFESLPALHREGGDLDLLVADEDQQAVISFIEKNSGPIPVDVWPVSAPHYHGMPYYPPKLARQILENAVEGPIGAKVPSKTDYLHSFIYHCLYQKGALSGIPSTTPGVQVTAFAENDYKGVVAKLAQQAGKDLRLTMEDLDKYLATVGWKPKLDTLAKLQEVNVWIRKYFFSQETVDHSLCVGVLLVRKLAVEAGLLDDIGSLIRVNNFHILRQEIFTPDRQKQARDNLRGGIWSELQENSDSVIPAAIFVIVDRRLPESQSKLFPTRLRELKVRIRKTIDSNHSHIDSAVHSTDDTVESLEYLKELYPQEIELFKTEAKAVRSKVGARSNSYKLDVLKLRFQLFRKQIFKTIKKKLTQVATGHE